MFAGVGESLSWRFRSAIDEAWCLSRLVRSYRRLPPALVEEDGSWCTTECIFHTPVVLVHGAAHNGSAWTPLSECLRAAGFERLVTLDYRASATPSTPSRSISAAASSACGRGLEQSASMSSVTAWAASSCACGTTASEATVTPMPR